MKHIHQKTGLEFEVGTLGDFDMTVITFWPNEDEDELVSPEIVNYYFGEYDSESTDHYIDDYLERKSKLKAALEFLEDKYLIDWVEGKYMDALKAKDLKDCIEEIKKMI